ncbi:hypothetical protein HDU91_003490, partial [Kappamyces sp. JEL0680]
MGVADGSPTLFYEAVDWLGSHSAWTRSHQSVFNELASSFLASTSAMRQELFRAEVATRTFAPAVQAFHHLYQHVVLPADPSFADCSVWVHWDGRQICDKQELLDVDRSGLWHSQNSSNTTNGSQNRVAFDLPYRSLRPDAAATRTAILYAALDSPEFLPFFKILQETA